MSTMTKGRCFVLVDEKKLIFYEDKTKRWISRQESDQCEIIIIVDGDKTLRSASILRVREKGSEQKVMIHNKEIVGPTIRR